MSRPLRLNNASAYTLKLQEATRDLTALIDAREARKKKGMPELPRLTKDIEKAQRLYDYWVKKVDQK